MSISKTFPKLGHTSCVRVSEWSVQGADHRSSGSVGEPCRRLPDLEVHDAMAGGLAGAGRSVHCHGMKWRDLGCPHRCLDHT
jgi:hypothetical protein